MKVPGSSLLIKLVVFHVYICVGFSLSWSFFIALTRTDVLDSHLKKGPTSLDQGPVISGLVPPELRSTEK